MEEKIRLVRAHSDETQRPYYTIRFELSLEGRSLFANAQQQSEVAATAAATAHARPQLRRSISAGNLDSGRHDAINAGLREALDGMPSTPKRGGGRKRWRQERAAPAPLQGAAMPPAPVNMRRSRSAATQEQLALFRSAPAPVRAAGAAHGAGWMPQALSQHKGFFVTCLNSKNVAKYSVGQRYRKVGVIVGIDHELGKIIVASDQLPASSLVCMRTRRAARYECGHEMLDVRGNSIGTVHAVDRIHNLIVVNTTPGLPG